MEGSSRALLSDVLVDDNEGQRLVFWGFRSLAMLAQVLGSTGSRASWSRAQGPSKGGGVFGFDFRLQGVGVSGITAFVFTAPGCCKTPQVSNSAQASLKESVLVSTPKPKTKNSQARINRTTTQTMLCKRMKDSRDRRPLCTS